MKIAVSILWVLVAVTGIAVRAQAPQKPANAEEPSFNLPGTYAEADIAYGAQIYAAQCSSCHGPLGNGVAGIDLRAGRFRRVVTDRDLQTVITGGVAGTAMPPFNFNPSELAGIVAYVRKMSEYDSRSVAVGDPARGHRLFESTAGCAACHRVHGKGPRVAPELSDIGSLRTAAELQRVLLDPNRWMRSVNRSVRVTTRDGRAISGRRLNEDTYTIQLIDTNERLVSLLKSDVRDYTVVTTSGMPSYKDKLTPQEIADVVAYLLSLRGL